MSETMALFGALVAGFLGGCAFTAVLIGLLVRAAAFRELREATAGANGKPKA